MACEAGSLSIVIAASNEEKLIKRTATDLLPVARNFLPSFELILVDDGSTDQTGAIMEELARTTPEISVIHHARRAGMGSILQSGLNRATKEKILLLPGDSAYSAESLAPFFKRSAQADIVIGCRANLAEAVNRSRFWISRLYCRTICLLLDLPLQDVHGLVIYPCSAVKAAGIRSRGITFQIEMLAKLIWSGYSLSQGPVFLNVFKENSSRSLRWKSFSDLLQAIVYLLSIRHKIKADLPSRKAGSNPH